MKKLFLLLFISGFTSIIHAENQNSEIIISSWKVSESGTQDKFEYTEEKPYSLLGLAYSFARAHNTEITPDPKKIIDYCLTKSWDFESVFEVTREQLNLLHADLELKEIYTFCEVIVNGKKIDLLQNAFVTHHYDIRRYLKRGKNKLLLRFSPVNKTAEQLLKDEKIVLPADNQPGSIKYAPYIRQPQYLFGWDFAFPNYFFGITRLPVIRFHTGIKIKQLNLNTILSDDYEKAIVQFRYQIVSDVKDSADIYLSLTNDRYKTSFSDHLSLLLQKGTQNGTTEITIDHPRLWYPRGVFPVQRESELYTARFMLFQKGKEDYRDFREMKTGFRKVELVQEEDQYGTSFYFTINGKKIFAKGYNLVREAKEELFQFSNFNMLRVWGGGNYLTEECYTLADKYGVMIWQDFMFANSYYPGNKKFLDNVKTELDEMIPRINNHPSLVMWCGNNEIEVAAKNWGWKNKYHYSDQDSLLLENNYKKLFKELIPQTLEKFNSQIPYISSSPLSNWGKPEDFGIGDNHYWGVWHGEEPVTAYENHIPRFASEFGLPSVPAHLFGPYFLRFHDQVSDEMLAPFMISYKGLALLKKYITAYARQPEKYYEWVFLSEATQANALRTAILAQRLHNDKCSGSLVWQLNGGEGVIDWSVTDEFDNVKNSFYVCQHSFEPVVPIIETQNDSLFIHIINDYASKQQYQLRIKVIDNTGDIILHVEKNGIAEPQSNFIEAKIPVKALPDTIAKNKMMILAELESGNKIITQDYHFFVPVKKFAWQRPTFDIKWIDQENVYEVKSNTLSFGVTLYYNAYLSYFRDNYLLTYPGEGLRFRLKNKTLEDHIRTFDEQKIKIDCLNNYFVNP